MYPSPTGYALGPPWMWNSYPMSTLGERIKLARGKASQDVFSRALKISKGSLGFYERNENLPNTDVILKICSETGVSLVWLLTGTGPMYPEETTPLVPTSSAPAPREPCPSCMKMEAKLDLLDAERRELAAENRRLWQENADLRERCARFEERQNREEKLSLFDKKSSFSSDHQGNKQS